VRILLFGLLFACAHHPPQITARNPLPHTPAVTVEPDLPDDPSLYKLPDYQPIQSFLEKTSPHPSGGEVYITLMTSSAPMSLERKTIESAAHECFLYTGGGRPVEITMTLETRDDGTLADASFDGASMPLGECMTQRLAKVPLHEEGKREHIVIVVNASFTSNAWHS
jgi:hypothetical protein